MWSGGDYNESALQNLNKATALSISASGDYSHIGNKSIKLEKNGEATAYFVRIVEYDITGESIIGQTASFTAYFLSPTDTVRVSLAFLDSNGTSIDSSSVYGTASSTEQTISINKVIPNDTGKIRVNLYIYVDECSYVDGVQLNINPTPTPSS